MTGFVEGEFRDVADVDLLTGREFAQQEVGTFGLIVARRSAARGRRRWRGFGAGDGSIWAVALQSDPRPIFIREGESPNFDNLGFFACNQIHDTDAALQRLLLAFELRRFGMRGKHHEGRILRVAGNRYGGCGRY